MLVNFYLVVNDNGTIKTTKNRPDLKWNEIAIQCALNLPYQLFQKPKLSATITIPEEAAIPDNLPVEVQENVKAAIEQATGIEVKLEVVSHDAE